MRDKSVDKTQDKGGCQEEEQIVRRISAQNWVWKGPILGQFGQWRPLTWSPVLVEAYSSIKIVEKSLGKCQIITL